MSNTYIYVISRIFIRVSFADDHDLYRKIKMISFEGSVFAFVMYEGTFYLRTGYLGTLVKKNF